MAVGVRFYGRGTARPGDVGDEPYNPTKTTTNKSPYLSAEERRQLEQARVAGIKSGAVQVPTPTATQTAALDPVAIANALAEGITFNIPSLFPAPAASTGDGGSSTLAAKLADLAYQREKDKAETRLKTQGAAASSQMIQDMLSALPTRFQGLGNLIGETGRTNEAYIQEQYRKALEDLTSRKTTGETLQERGFSAARSALERMQPTAFEAPALELPAAATNTLAQFLSARGVPQEQIQAEVVKVNQASQNAQTNYTGLLNTLSAIERNAAQSRQVENNLAQAVANAQLQTIYGGATSGLEQQRLKGLNDLFNQLQAQRFQLEQAKIAREDALNDALATLAQSGYPIRGANPPSDETDETITPGTGTGGGGNDRGPVPVAAAATPAEAIAQLAQLAPTEVNAPVTMMERQMPSPEQLMALMALARQEPTYGQGAGGGGGGVPIGNAMVAFAKGGVVTKPTIALIGEDGPEAVVPLTKPAAAKRVGAEARKAMLREKFKR